MKPPLTIIALICMVITLISCTSNSTGSDSTELSYAILSETLESAYVENSQEQLDTFFEDWDDMISPISPDEFTTLSKTKQEAYRLFEKFYSPDDLNRLTHGEHENFESDFRYVVIQNRLEVAVADTNPQFYYYRGVQLTQHTIADFRPKLPKLEYPSVYLTEEADSVIYNFLFTADSTHQQDTSERASFLQQTIQLTPHHWIVDYHKFTMPHAQYVVFNENYTEALVLFRVFFQFGEAYFEKEDENWMLKHSELTAIE